MRSVQTLVDDLAERLGVVARIEAPATGSVEPVGALRHNHREGV
jgi:hypothetical protein